eukprot:13279514-Heterocapsa_arctica.AAC.1
MRAGCFYLSAGFAKFGLPAGSSWSDIMVRIYCISPFRALVQRHPLMSFDFYIDDFGFGTTGAHNTV